MTDHGGTDRSRSRNVVVVVRAAPDNPEMSVPGVGYSFKPKGLAFVTPLYPV